MFSYKVYTVQIQMFCYIYIFPNKNVLLYIHSKYKCLLCIHFPDENVIVILPGTAVQRKGKLFNICMYVFSTFLFLTVLYSFIN